MKITFRLCVIQNCYIYIIFNFFMGYLSEYQKNSLEFDPLSIFIM